MLCQHDWKTYDEPIKDDVFVRCERCQVVRTVRKAPMNECLAAQNCGRPYYEKPDMHCFAAGIPLNEEYFASHMRMLGRLMLGLGTGTVVLEIGPGIGAFVPHYLRRGCDVVLWESDRWAAAYLKNAYYACRVIEHDFQTHAAPDAEFDAVVSCHCLEHFPNADLAFQRMVQYLAPNGRIYIEVPFGYGDLYVHDHWWHFNEHAIRTWAEDAGLEDVVVETTPIPRKLHLWNIHMTARKPERT